MWRKRIEKADYNSPELELRIDFVRIIVHSIVVFIELRFKDKVSGKIKRKSFSLFNFPTLPKKRTVMLLLQQDQRSRNRTSSRSVDIVPELQHDPIS